MDVAVDKQGNTPTATLINENNQSWPVFFDLCSVDDTLVCTTSIDKTTAVPPVVTQSLRRFNITTMQEVLPAFPLTALPLTGGTFMLAHCP